MEDLFLEKCDQLVLLENQKRGFCLISAFFQGLHFHKHSREGRLLQEIIQAMRFVILEKREFGDMSGESMNGIQT